MDMPRGRADEPGRCRSEEWVKRTGIHFDNAMDVIDRGRKLEMILDTLDDGVSSAQLVCLFFLLKKADMGEKVTMTQIGEERGTSAAVTTGLVNRIEQAGWAERYAPKRGDKRFVYVRITNAGRSKLIEVRRKLEAYEPGVAHVGT